jgi:hypothetical protein
VWSVDDETNILMADEAGTRKDQFWTADHKTYNIVKTILICYWTVNFKE